MAEMNKEQFEEKCMDIIEQIVARDVRQDRLGAIKVAELMLKSAQEKTTNAQVLAIYERVLKEFKIATDAEYLLLRKQIFGEK
ncbi:MAG: hypothetical protein E7374_03830 [Clostridiales bacterium]|nr:hypothetical protein [Clostridiales bacterium]